MRSLVSFQERLKILEGALAIDADVLALEEVRSRLDAVVQMGLLCTPRFSTCPSSPTSRLSVLLFFDSSTGLGLPGASSIGSARTCGHQ
jgi:hypothetical protein